MKKTEKITTLAALICMVTAKAVAQEQRISEGERRIVISIPDRKLALIDHGRVVRVFDVAVGAPVSPSPEGEFVIEARIPHPTWFGPHGPVSPGKANPLGTRWLGLSKRGYGIHGTNRPASIGHNVSHGCIRMKNQNVEELFELVRAGDRVELHGERDAAVAAVFGEAAAEAVLTGGGE